MMSDLERIVGMALVALPEDRIPTEPEIEDTVRRVASLFKVDDATRSAALRSVLARRLVKMDKGYALAVNHVPWVDARRPTITPFYWERFRLHLQKDLAPAVVTGLDKSTDAILDLIGNPAATDTWKRRGLVMGDVQSGKTAAYSGLICKAADAGYRFIVLLAGTIENLRRQTQERLDAGFVGFDSSEKLKRNSKNLRVGVGLLDGTHQATVFTSSLLDFRLSTMQTLGLSLDALKEPALVVIKKNTKILENLRNWIRNYNTTSQDGCIDIPMLMIDDEADNASINTRDDKTDPTAVNAGIRELLGLFRRTSYVGFTATPFANIFVNPESEHEMLGDDLFPSDFIYTLQPPSNYFGPRRIFLDDEGGALHLRPIDDVEVSVPSKHKSDTSVHLLPRSLVTALAAFLVGNAIRDLRGEGKTHRSMLVNVSQYTAVQDQMEVLLHDELERFRVAIRSYSALPPDTALTDARIASLQAVWTKEYASAGFSWAQVQAALHDSALQITTKAVNQRTGTRALDYRAHRDTGLRVVAVGGNSLSRGLTLEGLMISYFRRTTKMYDTLLQMGRWFGYRPGYEDLCRVWLPQEAIDWYGHISEATDELRDELLRMVRIGKTPRDFGLAVRAHPDALLVTARNKMRSSKDVTRFVSLSGQSFESVQLPTQPEELGANADLVSKFLVNVSKRQGDGTFDGSTRVIGGAKREEVAKLLRGFRVPATEFRFQPSSIADLLETSSGSRLDTWDVGVAGGEGAKRPFGGLSVAPQTRLVRREGLKDAYVVSGRNQRVGSRGVEKAGLTGAQKATAEANARRVAEEAALAAGRPTPGRVNVSDGFYRAQRERPLLLVHLLDGHLEKEGGATLPGLVAIGLSFPRLDDDPNKSAVKYRINMVKARELFESVADEDDDVPDEELM